MKRVALVLSILVITALSAAAQKEAPAAAELKRLVNEFLSRADDPAMHEIFWADDVIYTRSTGVRTNKDEILKGMRSAPARKPTDPKTKYWAEDVLIHQYGDTAVVSFKLMIEETQSNGTVGLKNNLNTGTFLKRGGKWQVIAWQSTIAPIKEDVSKPAATTSTIKPAALSSAASPSTQPASITSRLYQKGPRGGCYYLNAGGNKVYVDHKFCN
jgi:hypothetical protein